MSIIGEGFSRFRPRDWGGRSQHWVPRSRPPSCPSPLPGDGEAVDGARNFRRGRPPVLTGMAPTLPLNLFSAGRGLPVELGGPAPFDPHRDRGRSERVRRAIPEVRRAVQPLFGLFMGKEVRGPLGIQLSEGPPPLGRFTVYGVQYILCTISSSQTTESKDEAGSSAASPAPGATAQATFPVWRKRRAPHQAKQSRRGLVGESHARRPRCP